MRELANAEIGMVSGATSMDVKIVASGATAGAVMGTVLGPVGTVAGAVAGAVEGAIAAYFYDHA